MVPFQYEIKAPASLCKPHHNEEDRPHPDDNGPFMTSLVERYNPEILYSRDWRCITCSKPAKEIFHSTIALLSLHAEIAMLAGFVPTVMDVAAPICFSGGACDRHAAELLRAYQNDVLFPSQCIESKTCNKCGKKSGVKVCGGCKLMA